MTATDVEKLERYRPPRDVFVEVEVPEARYLMIDGHGAPNTSPAFTQAVETLYAVASTLKLTSRRGLGRDYVVPPLEGLWWAEDMSVFTTARDKSAWDWTLLLLVPEWLGPEHVEAAVAAVSAKGKGPRLAELRHEVLAEGRCVQTLRVGSFEAEGPVLARLSGTVGP